MSDLIIHRDIEQNTEAWRQIRCGLPTASEFSSILAKGEGKTRRSYLLRLAGEVLTGCPADTYESADMIRGREMEANAREYYSFLRDIEPELVGFITNGQKGCSPDAILGDDGILEIKTAKPSVQIERLLKNELPSEHRAQCQGALWVAEREFVEFISYWPKMPPLIVRVERDEDYIANLAAEVSRFNEELAEVVDRVRRYGTANV